MQVILKKQFLNILEQTCLKQPIDFVFFRLWTFENKNKKINKMILKSIPPSMPKFFQSLLSIYSHQKLYFSHFQCHNCSKKTVHPECTACQRMVNYFNIFNIPQQFNVNQETISMKAKELQKQYHPDKHSSNQNMENIFKDKMIKYSAYINEAKATLLDDLRRAIYMMELRGVQIEDSSRIHDNKFMMQMFSLQQQIQQADKQTCQEIKHRIEGIIKSLQTQFDNFFKAQDMAMCTEFVSKCKYLHKALQNVNKKLNAHESRQY